MKNLTQIADELRELLYDIELIIGEKKDTESNFVLTDMDNMSINLNDFHAESTLTVADSYDDFQIVFTEESLDNTKKV